MPFTIEGDTALEMSFSAKASASARAVLAARVVGLAATFLGSVALARALGPEGRGAQAFFVACTVILVAISGLSTPIGDYILATRKAIVRRRLAVNAVWLALAAGIVGGLSMGILQSMFGLLPPVLAAVPGWQLAMTLAIVGFSLNAHQIQLALAAGRALAGAFLSFGTFAIAGVGYVGILLAGGGLPAAMWMVVLAPYLAAIVALLARPPLETLVFGAPDRYLAARTAREGVRFFPGDLAAIAHLRIDVILLGVMTPTSAIGVYVVAYQTAEPILVIASAATASVLALGHGLDETGRATAVVRLIRETIVLGGLLALAAAICAPVLIPLIYGAAFSNSVVPFLILLPAVLALAVGRIGNADLIRRNHLEDTVLVSSAALAINVIANLILIPPLGATGAALASLVSYTSYAVLAIAFQRRVSGVKWFDLAPRPSDLASLATAWDPRRLARRLTHLRPRR